MLEYIYFFVIIATMRKKKKKKKKEFKKKKKKKKTLQIWYYLFSLNLIVSFPPITFLNVIFLLINDYKIFFFSQVLDCLQYLKLLLFLHCQSFTPITLFSTGKKKPPKDFGNPKTGFFLYKPIVR